jgi:hypothetical protein
VCQEWAERAGANPEAERLENRLIGEVFNACRPDNQSAYVAFRRLLIEHPVLTALELHRACIEPALRNLVDQVRQAYQLVPPECVTEGDVRICRGCGNVLIRMTEGPPQCVEERCLQRGVHNVARTIPAHEEVYWLRMALRAFISAPGQAELRLARKLSRLHLKVELWPKLDTFDLYVCFPGGDCWAVDVKDWTNPVQLAYGVTPFSPTPEWTRAFFVFPNERARRRPDYLPLFEAHCRILGGAPPTSALMEDAFMASVHSKLKGTV